MSERVEIAPAEKADAPPNTPPLGEHCTSDPPLDPSEKSSGEIVKLADVEVYISKPADSESQATALLLLLSNGVGVHSVNNQVQADHFAKAGYFVVMPDLFKGDPAPRSTNVNVDLHEESPTLLEQVKIKAVEGIKEFMLDMWLARHTPETTEPVIESVLHSVKEKYGDQQYTMSLGTYVVGYCFGGKYALRLAARDGIAAAAVAHGTLVTAEDFKHVKQPVVLVCVEGDPLFPSDIRDEGKKILEENGIEHDLRVYKDVPHGFAVYGSYPDAHISRAQEEAFKGFVDFLGKH